MFKTVSYGLSLILASSLFLVDNLSDQIAKSNERSGESLTPVAGMVVRARQPLVEGMPPQRPAEEHQLVVKFHDAIQARAIEGQVRHALARDAEVLDSRLAQSLFELGVRFEPLIQLPAETILFLELRGALLSGIEQPDLAGMLVIKAPEHLLDLVALTFYEMDQVEWVEFMLLNPPPPQDGCNDIPPTTPNYTNSQGYRGPNAGLNMNAFWALGNARGAGIRVADCEYGYRDAHEDLCGIIPEPNQTPRPEVFSNNWHEHGTAVLGEIMGGENAYGVTGLSPAVQGYFFPEWTVQGGSRRVTCIANAIAAMNPGDIVLLEMQTSIPGGSGFGPAELSLAVWTVVRNGVDGGVVVVGAAGNGDQNLDGPEYQEYRNRGDSGAIIVGAGSATVAHNKLSFSTYGSRVNVQGWGQSVFTTGYGGFATIGGDLNQGYTSTFSGTSSASPFIASACASLQSYAVANIGRRLTPAELRQIFSATGHPQGTGGNIGRFPDMVQAAQYVIATWGAQTIAPTALSFEVGQNIQGGLSELALSDDQHLCVDSSVFDERGIPRVIARGIQFDVQSTLANANPSSLRVRLEGHCKRPDVTQTIEVYNFQTLGFQLIDSRLAAENQDGIAEVTLPGSPGAYIQAGTQRVRARITFRENSPIRAVTWRTCIDQFVWISTGQ